MLLIKPKVYEDLRGAFFEGYNRVAYSSSGIPGEGKAFDQDNFSVSRRGVIRGLHYQEPNGQGKLVSVLSGQVFDVAVDLRRSSSTFGGFFSAVLSEENRNQLWIPTGFAHGFCALTDNVVFHYKCSGGYKVDCEKGILWNDSDLGIPWPIDNPIVSEKDRMLPRLDEIAQENLPANRS